MSLTLLAKPSPGLRLCRDAVAVPALTSAVRPALVLPEEHARALLDAAARLDVRTGGRMHGGLAGIQVWNGPFDGEAGGPGSAVQLGAVDWTYDTPARHWALIYRAMVTQGGIDAGETTTSILTQVLRLAGLTVSGDRVQLAVPPPRDPFKRAATGSSR